MADSGFIEQLKKRLENEFLAIERNSAYTDDEKVQRLIFTTSALCAGIAIQPIPFADMPILTTIQGFMGWEIAKIRGIELTQEGTLEVVKYLGGVVGAGWLAQHGIIGLYKAGLPFLGGLMTIPLVFGITFGIGRAMDLYFCAKKQGRMPTAEEIKRAFARGKDEGKQTGKSEAARRAVAGEKQ